MSMHLKCRPSILTLNAFKLLLLLPPVDFLVESSWYHTSVLT